MSQLNINGNKKLLTIFEKYASLIYSGKKTIELRKKDYGLASGDFIGLFESDSYTIRGGFIIKDIIKLSPEEMYENHFSLMGITKEGEKDFKDFYFKYYKGKDFAFGFTVREVIKFDKPLSKIDINVIYKDYLKGVNGKYEIEFSGVINFINSEKNTLMTDKEIFMYAGNQVFGVSNYEQLSENEKEELMLRGVETIFKSKGYDDQYIKEYLTANV